MIVTQVLADAYERAINQSLMSRRREESLLPQVEHLTKNSANKSYHCGPPTFLVVIFHLATSMVLFLLYTRYKRSRTETKAQSITGTSKPTKQRPPKRTVSFTSAMLAKPTMPSRVKYPDPIINATTFFDTCPSTQDVIDDMVVKLLQYERMAKIPVLTRNDRILTFQPPPRPLDPARLVRRLEIHCDKDDGLFQTIRTHIHDPLSSKQRDGLPWWEILILDNRGAGQSACMWRIHHALGDGISLATVAQHILKNVDGSPIDSVIPKGMMEKRQTAIHSNSGRGHNDNQELSWYTMAYKLALATAQVMALPWTEVDHPTVFSQNIHHDMTHTRNRDLVIFPTMPLAFVKAIKDAALVTINDVLFTCLSQAIHDYLELQDCAVLKQKRERLLCRAMIAAVLPRAPSTMADSLVNKWFMLSSDMGIGGNHNQDILQRLQWIHNHLNKLKQSPLPLVGLAMQNYLMPWFPDWLNEQITFRSLASHSMSISNVPGPSKTCLIAKQPAVGVQMFLSNLVPHVGLISYRDFVFGNICVDPQAVPDCHSLAPLYGNAMIALAQRLEVPVPAEVAEAVTAAATAPKS